MSYSIEDAKNWSFEAQLYGSKRMLEFVKAQEVFYRNGLATHIHKSCVEAVDRYEKKIKILNNLIDIYGPNPCGTEYFIGLVYGDRDPSRDGDIVMHLPNEYYTGLRQYSENGQVCYVLDRIISGGNYTKLYVADGKGKYRFWKYL